MAAVTGYQNLTDFDAALKDIYEGVVRKQLNDEIVGLKMFQKKKSKFQGRQIVFPVHVQRSSAVGAIAEAGTLPVAQHQGLVQAKVSYVRNYGAIQLTADVMKTSATEEGAFAEAMTFEMERLVTDLKKDVNRQFWGNGQGTLATIPGTTTAGATTITVDSTRFLAAGMRIDIWDSASGNNNPGLEIASVNSTTSITLVAATAANTLVNARIKRKGSGSAYGTSYELTGMQAIVDDGTVKNILHNVNATTYPVWQSVRDGSSTTLSADLLQRKLDKVYRNGGSKPNVLLCDPTLRRDYVALTVSNTRYKSVNDKDIGWSQDGLVYTGGDSSIPIVTDIDCPIGYLFGVTKENIKFYQLCDFEWADEDGTILKRGATQDIYEARMRMFGDFATDKRNAHFVFAGLTPSSTWLTE